MSDTGAVTPPMGYTNGNDYGYSPAGGGDPEGNDPQGQSQGQAGAGADPNAGSQPTGEGTTPDPLADYRLQDGTYDSNLLSEAYLKQQQEVAGLKQLIDQKIQRENQLLAAQGQAPVAQPAQPQQPKQDPLEAILQGLEDGTSALSADDFRRIAQIADVVQRQSMNNVFTEWTRQMQQQDQAQAQRRTETVLQQTRNQFGTVMQQLAISNPDLAGMDQEMVQFLDSNPAFTQKLQGMLAGGPGFSQEEVTNLIMQGRNMINQQRQQQLAALQQQMGQFQQAPPPQQAAPAVDSYGRPAPGQVPGQIPTGYAQQAAQQAQIAATQAMNRQPDPNVQQQQMSPQERAYRERWRGFFPHDEGPII